MQSMIFMFIGLTDNNIESQLDMLQEGLNSVLVKNKILSQFNRSEEILLMSELDDVSFYVSLVNTETELEEWIQMAKDFELSIDLSEVNNQNLIKRYESLKKRLPALYSDIHYTLAKIIFEEMNTFPGIQVYSFE